MPLFICSTFRKEEGNVVEGSWGENHRIRSHLCHLCYLCHLCHFPLRSVVSIFIVVKQQSCLVWKFGNGAGRSGKWLLTSNAANRLHSIGIEGKANSHFSPSEIVGGQRPTGNLFQLDGQDGKMRPTSVPDNVRSADLQSCRTGLD